MRVSHNQGYPFGDPYNEDNTALGYKLGPPDLEKIPHEDGGGRASDGSRHCD